MRMRISAAKEYNLVLVGLAVLSRRTSYIVSLVGRLIVFALVPLYLSFGIPLNSFVITEENQIWMYWGVWGYAIPAIFFEGLQYYLPLLSLPAIIYSVRKYRLDGKIPGAHEIALFSLLELIVCPCIIYLYQIIFGSGPLWQLAYTSWRPQLGYASLLFLGVILLPTLNDYLKTKLSERSQTTDHEKSVIRRLGLLILVLAVIMPSVVGYYSEPNANIQSAVDIISFLIQFNWTGTQYMSLSIFNLSIQSTFYVLVGGLEVSLFILLSFLRILAAIYVVRYLIGQMTARRAMVISALSEIPTVIMCAYLSITEPLALWVPLPLLPVIFGLVLVVQKTGYLSSIQSNTANPLQKAV